jgi:hypothetical protein
MRKYPKKIYSEEHAGRDGAFRQTIGGDGSMTTLQRDLKIAEAVRDVCISVVSDLGDTNGAPYALAKLDIPSILATIPPEQVAEWKDHQTAWLVNNLRDIAITYGHTQQLREQIKGVILPLVDSMRNPEPVAGLPAAGWRTDYDIGYDNGWNACRGEMLTAKLPEAQQPAQSCRKCSAYAMLVKSLEAQLSEHHQKADKYREAVATLESERQANAILSREHPELANIPDELPDSVIDATADAIGGAYDCMRVWEAWDVGTMGPDDFWPVADDPGRVAEIARAAIGAWLSEQRKGNGKC